jgi:hypothetical protein
MSLINATQGLAAVGAVTTNIGAQAPSNQCYVPLWVRGPYNGADPISRLAIGDVKRFGDGVMANKAWTNLLKMQGGYEALIRAGVQTPHVAASKNANATVKPAVMVCDSNGSCGAGTYGTLTSDMWTPYTGVHSTASNYQPMITPGTAIGQFPNGLTIISSAGTGVPSGTFVSSGQDAQSLAAAGLNTTGAYAVTGGVTLADQLFQSGNVVGNEYLTAGNTLTAQQNSLAAYQAQAYAASAQQPSAHYYAPAVHQPNIAAGVAQGTATVPQYANSLNVWGQGVAPFVAQPNTVPKMAYSNCTSCNGWS